MSGPVVESSAPRWVRRAQGTVVVSVAVVAFVGSYTHMQNLAAEAGEGWRAWLLPISVDGMVISASLTMFVRRRSGQRGGLLAWVTLLVGLGASLAANIASAQPTAHAQALAAVYPIALLAVSELAMQQIRAGEVPASSQPEPDLGPSLQARIAAVTVKEPADSLTVPPAPSTNVDARPAPVDLADLLPVAREVAGRLGRVPGWKVMAKEIRDRDLPCGTPKAQALVAALKAEQNGHAE